MSADQTTAPLDSSRATPFLLAVAVVAAVLASVTGAHAQAPAPVGPPPPPSGAPPAASAAPGTAPPIAAGGRQGAAEVSIVGGNVASARERALTEESFYLIGISDDLSLFEKRHKSSARQCANFLCILRSVLLSRAERPHFVPSR